jgi:hypothetical protein
MIWRVSASSACAGELGTIACVVKKAANIKAKQGNFEGRPGRLLLMGAATMLLHLSR